jgi:hypothetical protein
MPMQSNEKSVADQAVLVGDDTNRLARALQRRDYLAGLSVRPATAGER